MNVIVICNVSNRLKEYTTHGQIVREVSLRGGITQPWHALQLNGDQFLVSHGGASDEKRRVCAFSVDGSVKRFNDGRSEAAAIRGQMNFPRHPAVDGNGLVFVADVNSEIVLKMNLSPTDRSARTCIATPTIYKRKCCAAMRRRDEPTVVCGDVRT